MTNLFEKSPSTKTLKYVSSLPLDFPLDYLNEICTKYDLTYRVTSPHKTLNPVINRHGNYIQHDTIRIEFKQNQQNDFKLHAAMYELGSHSQPYIGNSKNQQKLKLKLCEIKKPLPFYNRETKQIEQPSLDRAMWPMAF